MTILRCDSVEPSSPFCDWLDLTYPLEVADDVEAAVRPRLAAALAVHEGDGLYRVPALRRFPKGVDAVGVYVELRKRQPTIKLDRWRDVGRLSISGQACESLRAVEEFAPLLADVSSYPHRVTRLDASVDLPIPGPVAVPLVLAAARAGSLKLGRKRVAPQDTLFFDRIDSRGDRTGTVRLRSRKVELSSEVYDKRFEMEEAGLADPGPLTRVELCLKAVGCTLRDACLPAAVFWNYGHTIVARPDGAPDWSANGAGFDLPVSAPPDYWRILQRRVDDWPELRQLAELADKLGLYGRRMLLGLIARALGVDLAEPLPAFSAGGAA